MGKNIGGQPKPWSKKLRIYLWYNLVKIRSGLIDRQLDDEFAWVSEDERMLCSSADRPRVFEKMGKLLCEPNRKDPRIKNMRGLVDIVNLDPKFRGIKEVYDSPFWDLLERRSLTQSDIQDQIEVLLNQYELKRLPLERLVYSPESSKIIQEKYSATHIYIACLNTSFNSMDAGQLTGISLLWLLFMQNEPSHSASIRSLLEEKLDLMVNDFFDRVQYGDQFVIYREVMCLVLSSKVDFSDRRGYSNSFEREGPWPILPKKLVGRIDDKFFAARYPNQLDIFK